MSPEKRILFFSDPETFGLPTTLSYLGIDWALFDLSEFNTYEPWAFWLNLQRTERSIPGISMLCS
ncbi:hypothetical protein [Methanosarcina horonobensis]|uniref:hypothetical protein n=1 Tax=Methanosarcina horonobensis TaxID=418008 RepID=UPI000AD07E0C|nr:hypothetical protein [Methanosarcina horonobensis]